MVYNTTMYKISPSKEEVLEKWLSNISFTVRLSNIGYWTMLDCSSKSLKSIQLEKASYEFKCSFLSRMIELCRY